MRNLYAEGCNADVYSMHDKHEWRTHFPTADLVREGRSSWSTRVDAKLLYYTHRIAGLLFPGHFIDVTGARMQGGCPQLFSHKAPVPREHTPYSNHSYKITQPKRSGCDCDDCKTHREFHASHQLANRAAEFLERSKEIGIYPEANDITDYCETAEGKLIFFELGIAHRRCKEALLRGQHPDLQNVERVLPLLDRLGALEAERKELHENRFNKNSAP